MFKAVVFGLGSIATKIHLPIMIKHPQIEIVGYYQPSDSTAQRVSKLFPLGKRIYNIEEMNDLGADAAFVFSPKHTHYNIIKELLTKTSAAIFTEKPLTSQIEHSREIVDLVNEINRPVLVNLNRRYAPVYKDARARFAENPPDVCIVQKNRPATEYRATLENAIHMVDLLLWFCGDPVEINGLAKYDNPYYENSVISTIKFKDSLGILVANRSAGEWMETLEAYGNETTVKVDSPEMLSIISEDRTETFKQTPRHMGWADTDIRLGFKASIDHFVHCLKTGEEPLTNVNEAYKTEFVLNQILKSCGLPLKDEGDEK